MVRLHRIYKRQKRDLCRVILKAKNSAWSELLSTINEDPWGLPYRIVMKRLSTGSSLTEVLDTVTLDRLLASLFPEGQELIPIDWDTRGLVWQDDLVVTFDEVAGAIKEKIKKNTAPGPNGIRATVFCLFPSDFLELLATCFTSCLKRGIFPRDWKVSRLVLIPKGSAMLDGDLPKARPICLLSELGKLFERIIASRIKNFNR